MVYMHFYNKTPFIPPRLPLPLLSVRNGKFLWQKRTETFKYEQRVYPIDHSRKKHERHVIAEKKNIPDKPSHNFII